MSNSGIVVALVVDGPTTIITDIDPNAWAIAQSDQSDLRASGQRFKQMEINNPHHATIDGVPPHKSSED